MRGQKQQLAVFVHRIQKDRRAALLFLLTLCVLLPTSFRLMGGVQTRSLVFYDFYFLKEIDGDRKKRGEGEGKGDGET